MAELRRKDTELTTADIAGRSEKPYDAGARPQLVRTEERDVQVTDPAFSTLPVTDEIPERRYAAESSVLHKKQEMKDTPAASEPVLGQPSQKVTEPSPTPLFSESEVGDFRNRWSNIQTAFVDEPRRVVEDADNLVASLMKKLAEGFASERERLEKQWDRGDNVSTEDLRLALQRYRSFFDRLLKV
jgi:hypothetical protein